MNSAKHFLAVIFVCFAVSSPKANGQVVSTPTRRSFSTATNYMSADGFQRWQTYQRTGVWWSGEDYRETNYNGYTTELDGAFWVLKQLNTLTKKYPYTKSFGFNLNVLRIGPEWLDDYNFSIEYRRDLRRLTIQVPANTTRSFAVDESKGTILEDD